MKLRPGILFAAVLLAASPRAASPGTDPLAGLSWLAGDWAGDDKGTWNEEHWMEPSGGMMLAMHRDLKEGKATSFEFLRIEATPDGIIYFASPKGAPARPFRMIENQGQRIVFENPEIEFPRGSPTGSEKTASCTLASRGARAARPSRRNGPGNDGPLDDRRP
jgi:hypothetical protein